MAWLAVDKNGEEYLYLKKPERYSYITGKSLPFPCKYKEALKHFILYHEC